MLISIVFVIIAGVGGFLAGSNQYENKWSQRSCIQATVYEWKQSYWRDTGIHCLSDEQAKRLGGTK